MNQLLWKAISCCVVSALILTYCAQHVAAQQTLGSINGTVVDPSGAAVPSAKVTVTDAAINFSASTLTQGTGFFPDLQSARRQLRGDDRPRGFLKLPRSKASVCRRQAPEP